MHVLGQHNYRRYSLSLDGNILAFHLKLSDILNCSELMKPIINSGPKFVLRYSVNEYTRDQLFYQLLVRHYNEIMGLEYFPILDIIKGDLRFRKLPIMKTKHYPNSAKNCSRVLSALDYELSARSVLAQYALEFGKVYEKNEDLYITLDETMAVDNEYENYFISQLNFVIYGSITLRKALLNVADFLSQPRMS